MASDSFNMRPMFALPTSAAKDHIRRVGEEMAIESDAERLAERKHQIDALFSERELTVTMGKGARLNTVGKFPAPTLPAKNDRDPKDYEIFAQDDFLTRLAAL